VFPSQGSPSIREAAISRLDSKYSMAKTVSPLWVNHVGSSLPPLSLFRKSKRKFRPTHYRFCHRFDRRVGPKLVVAHLDIGVWRSDRQAVPIKREPVTFREAVELVVGVQFK
jgi:hypothetical protein